VGRRGGGKEGKRDGINHMDASPCFTQSRHHFPAVQGMPLSMRACHLYHGLVPPGRPKGRPLHLQHHRRRWVKRLLSLWTSGTTGGIDPFIQYR
jgi:hypothetical protein